MSDMTVFNFDDFQIRTVTDGGVTWFVGKDVCEALGYADPTNAMKQHCKGVVKLYPLQTAGGKQKLRVLSEPDMYRLAAKSHLESAQRFEVWVFEDVLPTVRKTGSYSLPKRPATPNPTSVTRAHLMVAAAMRRIGVRQEMAMAAALEGIRADTGLTTEGYRLALPGVEDVAERLGMDAETAQKHLAEVRGEMAMLGIDREGAIISGEDIHRRH